MISFRLHHPHRPSSISPLGLGLVLVLVLGLAFFSPRLATDINCDFYLFCFPHFELLAQNTTKPQPPSPPPSMNSPADGRATATSSPAMPTHPQKSGQFPSQAAVARQGVVYPVASSGRGFIPKSPNQLDPAAAVRHPVPASARALAPSHPKQCFSPSLPLPDCNGCKELRSFFLQILHLPSSSISLSLPLPPSLD